MLSDEQVDELERLIVYSSMDNLPLILSRAIPLLFSELRTVRATLDSKVNSFLEGAFHGSGTAEAGRNSGLPGRDDGLAGAQEVALGSGDDDPVVAVGIPQGPVAPASKRSKLSGNRRAKKRDQGKLDAGGGGPEVGGKVERAEVANPGVLPISATRRLGQ